MMRRLLVFLALCTAAACLWSAPALAVDHQTAHLVLRSQPGDFIGLGSDYDLTYVDAAGFPTEPWITKALPTGEPSEVMFWLMNSISTPYYVGATLYFSTAGLGIPLQPGVYRNAVRSVVAGPGQPGLDVGFAGRGSNELTGNFTIDYVTFFRDPKGVRKVGTFSASFEQHCEGAGPALFGSLTYRNWTAPEPVPEPGTLSLIGFGLLPLARVSRRLGGSDRHH